MFTFRLERPDGTAADPPTFRTSVPNWDAGDTIPLGNERTLRVVEVRAGAEPDDDPAGGRAVVVKTSPWTVAMFAYVIIWVTAWAAVCFFGPVPWWTGIVVLPLAVMMLGSYLLND